MKKFLQNNRWAVLWGLLIFVLTCVPGTVLPKLPSYIDLFQPDKLVHTFIFAVFFFLLVRGFRKKGTPASVSRNAIILTFLISLGVAGLTELLQEFVIPKRVASPWDFIANVAGCFLGWGVEGMWGRREVERKT
ncbi:MAG: VanZ family protein [Bacteroidales bacterium]|nr:VanZ family protein [Bacteroidota bacterium]MBL6949134.1 VanZ family protein [Bacteroidales bacterium]